ncbi:Uncharacterised protein [Bordetella pertussis]|nr:Uncharacterised protein [Bordetella pertussis]
MTSSTSSFTLPPLSVAPAVSRRLASICSWPPCASRAPSPRAASLPLPSYRIEVATLTVSALSLTSLPRSLPPSMPISRPETSTSSSASMPPPAPLLSATTTLPLPASTLTLLPWISPLTELTSWPSVLTVTSPPEAISAPPPAY